MENFLSRTKDFIDSKFEEHPWRRDKSNAGVWLTAILTIVGLSVIAYLYKSFLTKKLKAIKDAAENKFENQVGTDKSPSAKHGTGFLQSLKEPERHTLDIQVPHNRNNLRRPGDKEHEPPHLIQGQKKHTGARHH